MLDDRHLHAVVVLQADLVPPLSSQPIIVQTAESPLPTRVVILAIVPIVSAIILAIILADAIGRLSRTKGQYSTASPCSPINHTATAWAILEGEDVEMAEGPWLNRMTRVA
jgi:hypothetical protein